MSTTRSRDDQTFLLPDGRVQGFAEYGSQKGFPVVFFHGYPSSRLEASGLDKVAARRQLRIIAPDRPGCGLSTPQPGRRIVDWPADVEALVRHLGLSRFAVLGGSGGGPYALACAHALPHEMMSAVGLLASAPPWEAGTREVLLSSRLGHLAAMYMPTGTRVLIDLLVASVRRGLATSWGQKTVDNLLEKLEAQAKAKSQTGADDDDGGGGEKSVEERRNEFLRTIFEAFAQGSEACVYEAGLLTTDWGIKFEDVSYNKILLWHGTKDKNSPVSMIRYMAERLPHSELREFEEDNHFAVAYRLDEVLSDLVPEEDIKAMARRTTV